MQLGDDSVMDKGRLLISGELVEPDCRTHISRVSIGIGQKIIEAIDLILDSGNGWDRMKPSLDCPPDLDWETD